MRKILSSIILSFAVLCVCNAQNVSERVYLSTDRSVYVAGDDMFCSAFIFDASSRALSVYSKTVYVEIASPEGPVATGKIAAFDGRGGGVLNIPNTVPTGNYRVVAYTSQGINEDGFDVQAESRVISVFNPFTLERSSAGVNIVPDNEYASSKEEPSASGDVSISVGEVVSLTNNSDKPVSVSLSFFHNDGIAAPETPGIGEFISSISAGSGFSGNVPSDFDGEVIRGRIVGVPEEDMMELVGTMAYFSVPGRLPDVYASPVAEDGSVSFYTQNIYGKVDAVLELAKPKGNSHLELVSPFMGVRASGLAPLVMCQGLGPKLERRSMAMQLGVAQQIDSLYGILPVPYNDAFSDGEEYILDDFTRFPVMAELFVEFIKGASTRKQGDKRVISLTLRDTYKLTAPSNIPPLVTLDGVPVVDQSRIFDYDPLLVEKIVVYPNTYNIGGALNSGVVNFITYKKNLPSYEFPDNARVLDYNGASYPVVAYLPALGSEYPDMRQTVLWHPMVDLEPGETRTLGYLRPSYSGSFDVVVEGVASDGTPVFGKTSTELK